MSSPNLETSRLLWERFLAGDTDGVLEFLDPDVEVHDAPDLPGASTYRGHAGWQEQIAKFREAFSEMDYRVLEQIERGDAVVTVIEASATGTSSGISGTVVYAQLEGWRDGRVISIRYFSSRPSALEALGE